MKNKNFNYLLSLNTKFSILNSSSTGFTLIEILIVIGITAIIATVGFLSFSGYRQHQLFEDSAQSIVAVLRDAYQRAVNQESGAQWGVHFEQVAGSRDFYALFNGSVYGSPVSVSFLPSSVEFSDPASGSKDIIFEQLTGLLASDSSVTIVLASDPSVFKTITVNTAGQIQY